MGPLSTFVLTVLLGVAVVAPARAQTVTHADSGRFIIFQGEVPVAREKNSFTWMGDSLIIAAETQRTLQDTNGVKVPFKKTFGMVVDSRDLGLKSYTSVQEFQGHTVTRGLVPGDTSISYYAELDGAGTAMRVAQPPGRMYVMDSNLFTLFEVICRSLAPRTFTTRPVQILAMGDTLATPVATVTRGAADTLQLGRRRVPARRYTFEDESATFELWADAGGRMLKLAHPESGLHVEREPDAPAPVRRRSPKR